MKIINLLKYIYRSGDGTSRERSLTQYKRLYSYSDIDPNPIKLTIIPNKNIIPVIPV